MLNTNFSFFKLAMLKHFKQKRMWSRLTHNTKVQSDLHLHIDMSTKLDYDIVKDFSVNFDNVPGCSPPLTTALHNLCTHVHYITHTH